MGRFFIAIVILLVFLPGYSQDTIRVNKDLFDHSIADLFTIYESKKDVSFDYFIVHWKEFPGKKLTGSVANLDFTTSTFFIYFTLSNPSEESIPVRLEVARPITNQANLYYVPQKLESKSGDAIPFNVKTVRSNRSVLPLIIQPHSEETYVLKLQSDGEIISLPIIFWKKQDFENQERTQQFTFGIFYGIFVFVIVIYLTFYVLLRDSLFLFYSVYVLMSGLLQFALDGYFHQFIFRSGGYLTQHVVIVVAGLTVFFALQYASRYLKLTGRMRTITMSAAWFVIVTVIVSLIPGSLYEFCYPLINGLSFLAVIYLLIISVRIRKTNPSISRLFQAGMSILLLGAVLFILGNFSVIDVPELTQNSLKAGTLVEILCLSILMAGKYKSLQEEKEAVQRQLVIELEAKNKLMSEANVRLEEEVVERTKEIETQRLLLKEKNDDLTSSITYAERIQRALLSNEERFKDILPDSFIFYRPKDIVSGDFFWIDQIEPNPDAPNGLIVYATADCTGHGVPGAFVSIICNNLLKLGRNNQEVKDPGTALDFVNREINEVLNSNYSKEQIRDGMDVALCAIDPVKNILYFSGAKNGVVIIRNGELIELKGDRTAIGFLEEGDFRFTTQEFELAKGDILYTYSDGYMDQFGGPDGKKFTSRRLKHLLSEIADQELSAQFERVKEAFDGWKGNTEQIDDILLIGVKIN